MHSPARPGCALLDGWWAGDALPERVEIERDVRTGAIPRHSLTAWADSRRRRSDLIGCAEMPTR
jgi:hypothetical protein